MSELIIQVMSPGRRAVSDFKVRTDARIGEYVGTFLQRFNLTGDPLEFSVSLLRDGSWQLLDKDANFADWGVRAGDTVQLLPTNVPGKEFARYLRKLNIEIQSSLSKEELVKKLDGEGGGHKGVHRLLIPGAELDELRQKMDAVADAIARQSETQDEATETSKAILLGSLIEAVEELRRELDSSALHEAVSSLREVLELAVGSLSRGDRPASSDSGPRVRTIVDVGPIRLVPVHALMRLDHARYRQTGRFSLFCTFISVGFAAIFIAFTSNPTQPAWVVVSILSAVVAVIFGVESHRDGRDAGKLMAKFGSPAGEPAKGAEEDHGQAKRGRRSG